MFARRIRIDRALYARLEKRAAAAGYASVQELVAHVLEKEAARGEEVGDDAEAIRRRLEGLGYLS
jgi:hypothetical protein